jgi:cytidylate kinase
MAVITISRQYGSQGNEIATWVCRMLGYRYFDKSLMFQVAAEVGLSDAEVVDYSEDNHKVISFLDRVLGRDGPRLMGMEGGWKDDFAGDKRQPKALDEVASIALVQSTISAACRHGNVVIVGRGGQVLLRDMPGVLHVRIEAPMDTRVQRIQAQQGVSRETAQELVAKGDEAAADYLSRFYNVDGSDVLLYHLVINADRWEPEAAAHLIVQAVSYLPRAGQSARRDPR